MSHASFELLRREETPSLHLTIESYRHVATGARHVHLAANDPHNAFLTAFLTVPKDSTGVAHILEHTALCGSERYPVRDPFFMMLRRSLATFMNAFTSSDWTAYPFASQSRKDFNNLLNVYLDAAFFPNLAELDYSQEGSRVELEKPGDLESPLLFKGVVFNEMKGAMSSPARVLWEQIARHLFPTTTYHHNSGGDPERIPDLTWEQLRAFHAHHYHPSNAVFMTYGDIPAAEHQTVFEERVLSRFQRLEQDLAVPDERRFDAPLAVEEVYALEGSDEIAGKTHIVVSWLLGKSIDLDQLLQTHLLSGVLLDNSSSPLMRALETTDLGAAPSPVCGLDDSVREMVFAAGVEGSDPEKADAVEALVFAVLREVAEKGVEAERVEAVFHQLELSRREVGGDGFPYGLKLMLTALPAALHGEDPVSALALDVALERIRDRIGDPEFIPGLVRRQLLENPHRVRVVLKPDLALPQRRKEAETERLRKLKASLNREQLQAIDARAAELKARQEEEDDPEVLPKVTLADVPADLRIPEGRTQETARPPVTWFDQPTNGLVYQQVILDLPELASEQIDLLSLYGSFVTEVGCGGRDYLETQGHQALVTGGLSARGSVHGVVDDAQRLQGRFIISSKALLRNQEAMARLIQQTLISPRFDELERLRELVAQTRAHAELRVSDNGHALAMSAAAAGFSPAAALSERWGGLTAVRRLKALDAALNDPGELQTFADRLADLSERIAAAPRQLLVVAEGRAFEEIEKHLEPLWRGHASPDAGHLPFRHEASANRARVGWAAATQVNFCAKAYPTVPYVHADAPALMVLGQYLRNGFLHRAIREQGGAYGGGASFDADAGVFRFYSYRDPRMAETLDDFDRSIDWLLTGNHPEHQLEEAILGVIGAIDRPASPAGEARRAFHDRLNGRTPERRRAFRAQVLQVTLADLKRVAESWLQPDKGAWAVVSNGRALDEQGAGLDLERQEL